MALEIFKLVGSIFIDTDKANESLAKTDKKATSVAEGLGKAGKVAAGAAAAIGTAIIGTGTAMVSMANDASKTADEIDKASIRMGIGTEAYQELKYAAEQCGVEMGTLESAAKKLEGKDINFDEAIASIMELETAEERSAKAAELFGNRLAYTLSPLIEQSGDDFDGLRDRAHQLGLVMSEEAVKTGVEYNDLSSDLEKSFTALKTSLGSALFPVLNSVIKKIIEFMPTIQALGEKLGPIASDFIEKLIPPLANLAEDLLPVALDAVASLIPFLADITDQFIPMLVEMLQELGPVLMQIISEILPVISNLLALLMPILSQILKFITPILSIALQLLTPLTTLLSAILTPILNLINQLLTPLFELLGGILEPVLSILGLLLEPLTAIVSMILEPLCETLLPGVITPLLKILNECLTPLFALIESWYEWAAPVATKAFEWLRGFFNFVVTNLKGNLTTAFEGIGSVVKRVWEGMKNAFRDGINFWINAINTLIRGLNSINVPDWVSSKIGISNISLPEIPGLYEGGNVVGSGSVLVGEDGPEILNLPKGASVVPLDQANGIDYEKLATTLVVALKNAGFGNLVVMNNIGGEVFETATVNAINNANYRSGGR